MSSINSILLGSKRSSYVFALLPCMKMFDIVNESDQVIGTSPASQCHSNPALIHRVVHFTLVDTEAQKILISQRSPNVQFDSGMWCFMGEHLLQGDEYQAAVLRGAKDELGLSNIAGIKEYGHTIFYQERQTEFARFFVIFYQGGKIDPDPAEIAQVRWLTLAELKGHVVEYSNMTEHWIQQIDWEDTLHQSKY